MPDYSKDTAFKTAATGIFLLMFLTGLPLISLFGLIIIWLAEPIGSLLVDEKGKTPALMIKIIGWVIFLVQPVMRLVEYLKYRM